MHGCTREGSRLPGLGASELRPAEVAPGRCQNCVITFATPGSPGAVPVVPHATAEHVFCAQQLFMPFRRLPVCDVLGSPA